MSVRLRIENLMWKLEGHTSFTVNDYHELEHVRSWILQPQVELSIRGYMNVKEELVNDEGEEQEPERGQDVHDDTVPMVDTGSTEENTTEEPVSVGGMGVQSESGLRTPPPLSYIKVRTK